MTEKNQEIQDFNTRAAIWAEENVTPLASAIEQYAATQARGVCPVPRAYLREVPDKTRELALASIAMLVQGVVHGDGLTALAGKLAKACEKVSGKALMEGKEGDRQAIQLGYFLLSLVCDVTGAASIETKHGDRPDKVAGGVKVTPSYELVLTRAKFLEDAAAYGAAGMPTFSKAAPTPWQDQSTGGVEDQKSHGMVHAAGKAMAGVVADTAPGMFEAVNVAQRATFRVNAVTAAVVKKYDNAAAYHWLLAHYMKIEKDPMKAEAKARKAARL